jgi:hypothetical protein
VTIRRHQKGLLASIAHKEPDRIPLDLNGGTSSGIAAIGYNRLWKHLGLKKSCFRKSLILKDGFDKIIDARRTELCFVNS